MRVVSLAGPKGSGKNALATLITSALRAHRLTVEEVAFADPMRWACDAMGIPFHVTRGGKSEVSGHVGTATGRATLIAIGETMRGLCPNFWADHMYNRLDAIACSDPDALVIVTDTRRENEVDALDAWQRSGPGRLLARLWVTRPGADEDGAARLGLRRHDATTARNTAGVGLRASGGVTDLGAFIDTSHEERFLLEVEANLVVTSDDEVLYAVTTVDADIEIVRLQDGDPTFILDATFPV